MRLNISLPGTIHLSNLQSSCHMNQMYVKQTKYYTLKPDIPVNLVKIKNQESRCFERKDIASLRKLHATLTVAHTF